MPRWTPEARLRQAERIRQWSPWSKSTGPRTSEGKNRSKTNAWKGGVHWQERGYAEILRLWERRRKVISSFAGIPVNSTGMTATESRSERMRDSYEVAKRKIGTPIFLSPNLFVSNQDTQGLSEVGLSTSFGENDEMALWRTLARREPYEIPEMSPDDDEMHELSTEALMAMAEGLLGG